MKIDFSAGKKLGKKEKRAGRREGKKTRKAVRRNETKKKQIKIANRIKMEENVSAGNDLEKAGSTGNPRKKSKLHRKTHD